MKKNKENTASSTVRRYAASTSSQRDIKRLQRISRKVLRQLEYGLKTTGNTSAQFTTEQKSEWLFSGKHSLAHSLIAVSELMLKLDNALERAGSTDAAAEVMPLAESDISLLRHFVDKHTPVG